MQTDKKRSLEESSPNKAPAGGEKKFRGGFFYELAILKMKTKIAEQEVAVAAAKEKLEDETVTRDTLKAIEVVLRFMKAHETGHASFLYAPGQAPGYQLAVRNFLSGKTGTLSGLIRDSLVELTSKDRLESFMSSLNILTNSTCYIGKDDERAICYLDASCTKKMTCKRDNYIGLELSGTSCVGEKWVAYTNAREKK